MQRRILLSRLIGSSLAIASLSWAAARAQDKGDTGRTALLAGVSQLFTAIESSDTPSVRAALAPAMIGLTQLRDDLAQLMAAEQQIRYQLNETTIAQAANTAVVRTRWERRFLPAGSAQPQLRSGTVSLTFTKIDGAWLLASFSGDSPFEHSARR